jgi:alkaline phosphatase D
VPSSWPPGPGSSPPPVRRRPGPPPPRRRLIDLFTLGVASGDPLPDGAVLWTRLAPRPLDGGGMPDRDVPVRWEVAEDEAFRRVRARGTEVARGHSGHVDVRGSTRAARLPAAPVRRPGRAARAGHPAVPQPAPSTLEQAEDLSRTMTGAAQERWLTTGMAASGARWNLLANQVMWAQNARPAGPAQRFDVDCWDGYRVRRRRLPEFFGSGAVRSPVVLTGDRHRTWVCDLKPDFDDPHSPVVGAEITGTSLSSGGDEDPVVFHRVFDPVMRESPHRKYIDNRRGYVCDLSVDRLGAALRTVDTVVRRGGTVTTAARFVVRDGHPGVALD